MRDGKPNWPWSSDTFEREPGLSLVNWAYGSATASTCLSPPACQPLISPIAAKTIQGRTPFIGHLSNIQILRGIAAVMVLVYHIGNEFGDRGFPEPLPHFWMGSAGVDVFFVISGFIMVHSTAEAFARPGAPWLFLARRLVRLAPLYWLITTIFVVVALVEARHTGLAADAPRWFAASYAFLFYPHGDAGDFPLYAQGWTLNFEMFFYVCFAAVLPFRRTPALWALVVGFEMS